jgi:formate dehydrogenase accessory protein FdhE
VKSPPATASRTPAELERRAARAELLAKSACAAEQPLRFAAGLYRAQALAATAIEAAYTGETLTGHFDEDAGRLADPLSEVLSYAAREGPPALAQEARARQADLVSTARTRLSVYWAGDRSSFEDYLSRAMLRPYVELLRSINVAPDRIHRRGQCPFCSGLACVAVRREGSTMEGARRMLACALCGGEWLFERIRCPSCFEENPHKLPHFQNDKHQNVRVEACETCHRYVKSIDLSEDARPIPEVDDLLSLSMDLWATEQGYTRIEPGLAGI